VDKNSNGQDILRDAAEQQLERAPLRKLMPRRQETLLHELQVHQIELEKQNEVSMYALNITPSSARHFTQG
jgi:hypothetical protein